MATLVHPAITKSEPSLMNLFDKRTVLITGGSSGIGQALGVDLASRGANIYIMARTTKNLDLSLQLLEEERNHPEQKFGCIKCDVSNWKNTNEVLTQFVNNLGTPDFVINSAGVAHPGTFDTLDIEIFQWMMSVNYFGTIHVLKSLVPGMIEKRRGHIINISSIAGFMGVYGYTAYGASKFAIKGLSDSLRLELKRFGVNVSIVYPPDVDTPQLEYENRFKPEITKYIGGESKPLTASSVSNSIIKGIEKGKYVIIPGIENQLIFSITNILGVNLYPIMDFLVLLARKTSYKKRRMARWGK
jgi:3-dehydrosphinganine reductase